VVPGFEVLQELGRGGMGVVYKARQQGLGRLVALKMIPADYTRPEALARFRTEAEAVARLQHPNIVQIYEVGAHAGRPYLALEYASAGTLADLVRGTPLPARQAAALAETLARAVHAAHQQGVIHRDLKPANVLLSGEGAGGDLSFRETTNQTTPRAPIPKIADFGLAKLLDREDQAGAGATQTGAVLGTPCYMAPEQAWGKSKIRTVGPAVDVYALGAILYEALTGRPPFRAATTLETLEQVRAQEPVSPNKLQPGLPRDLQTICLKCLHKEPAKRYASARELAEDLARFLRHEPIRARPVGRWERLVKWVRRHPAAASLTIFAGLALLTLLAGVLAHNAQLRREVERAETAEAETRRQHLRADANYRAARTAINRMLDRFKVLNLAGIPRLKEFSRLQLEDALTFYQEVLKGADDPDPAVRLDAALAYRQTAYIQSLLGQTRSAAANYRKAVNLVERLAAEHPDVAEYKFHLADCYNHLGCFHAAGNDYERYCRRALAVLEPLARTRPNRPDWQDLLATAHHLTGVADQVRGRYSAAASHYDRAVAIRTRLLDRSSNPDQCRLMLADSLVNLGLVYESTRGPKAAERAYRRVEVLLGRPQGRNPARPEKALTLAAGLNNWGRLLKNTSRPRDALRPLGRAVELAEGVLRREPLYRRAGETAFFAHSVRAQAYDALGRYGEAVRDWRRAVELSPADPIVRLGRALSLAHNGEYRRAAADAEALLQGPKVPADTRWDVACFYALCIAPVRSDVRLPAAERAGRAERFARRAVALLEQLRAQGYFQDLSQAEQLTINPDFRPLRDRADFRGLLARAIPAGSSLRPAQAGGKAASRKR
jgi:tetratricopeptide (TPR) repeat protein